MALITSKPSPTCTSLERYFGFSHHSRASTAHFADYVWKSTFRSWVSVNSVSSSNV
jgi:hypothetical protein